MVTTNKRWLDDFTMELRLRDVPGSVIGDALETVESHLRDSGESAVDAFGDPTTYADSLELEGRTPARRLRTVRYVALSMAQLLGVYFTVVALPPVIRGQNLALPVVGVAILTLMLAALALFVAFLRYFLAPSHLLRLVVFWVVATAAVIGGAWLWAASATTVALPAMPALVFGLVLQLACGWLSLRSGPSGSTNIQRPGAQTSPARASLTVFFTVFLLPIVSVLVGLALALVPTS